MVDVGWYNSNSFLILFFEVEMDRMNGVLGSQTSLSPFAPNFILIR
jgi:hypothetical protein